MRQVPGMSGKLLDYSKALELESNKKINSLIYKFRADAKQKCEDINGDCHDWRHAHRSGRRDKLLACNIEEYCTNI